LDIHKSEKQFVKIK